jgi:hypothetical protein
MLTVQRQGTYKGRTNKRGKQKKTYISKRQNKVTSVIRIIKNILITVTTTSCCDEENKYLLLLLLLLLTAL